MHACSTAFVLQASLSSDVIGRGKIVSFYAPYRCGQCDFEEERLLETSDVARTNKQAPLLNCPACQSNTFELDDSSERFFDFIED